MGDFPHFHALVGTEGRPYATAPVMAESDQRRAEVRKARARLRTIGIELRKRFSDIVQEPVPDDMVALLKSADEHRPNGRETG